MEGLASSARRVNQRVVEVTDKRKGKAADSQVAEVSADGKTLTMTMHIPGRSQPNVRVFDRERAARRTSGDDRGLRLSIA